MLENICSAGTPTFQHDCEDCVFLTHWMGHDLYLHSDQHTTVIDRYSSDPASYISGIALIATNPYLAVAYAIAAHRGLL